MNFSSTWSMMKVYIICYIPARIPYLGKLEIRAKIIVAIQIVRFLNQLYLKNKMMK